MLGHEDHQLDDVATRPPHTLSMIMYIYIKLSSKQQKLARQYSPLTLSFPHHSIRARSGFWVSNSFWQWTSSFMYMIFILLSYLFCLYFSWVFLSTVTRLKKKPPHDGMGKIHGFFLALYWPFPPVNNTNNRYEKKRADHTWCLICLFDVKK